MKKTKLKQYLTSRQMASRIHSLLRGNTAKHKLPAGKTHTEALAEILKNYNANPRSIASVATSYVVKFRKPLITDLRENFSGFTDLTALNLFLSGQSQPTSSDAWAEQYF